MIKCKQALEGSDCGKTCCCMECEDREKCEDVCTNMSADCKDAFTEENAVATMQTEAAVVIKAIAEITVQKKALEEKEKDMKEQLKAAMEKYNVKSFENETVKFTYVAPTVENGLDSKALKADLPEIAERYTKQNPKAGYVKITVK